MLKFFISKLISFFFTKIDNLEDINSPKTNEINKKILNKNLLLKKYYIESYKIFKKELPKRNDDDLKILEIGSGAGFIKRFIPNVITSEIIKLKDIDIQLDAKNIKFNNNYFDAIILLNVFHHISDAEIFLKECNRVLKKNGVILMIEPANTWFSRIIYKNFHHEEFNEFSNWKLKKGGRLSEANQALPYIIFERDLNIFNKMFKNFEIVKKYKFKPFLYLLSGGFSYKTIFNNYFFFVIISVVEFFLIPFNKLLGLFMFIKIKKIDNQIN